MIIKSYFEKKEKIRKLYELRVFQPLFFGGLGLFSFPDLYDVTILSYCTGCYSTVTHW